MTDRGGGTVQSVGRALDLLEALAASPVPLSISTVAHATGLPVGTTHRLLQTLAGRGYVRQEANRDYAPGLALWRVSGSGVRSLVAPARQFLSRLVALTGETANLAVLDGDEVLYVAQVPSPHRLRMFADVGRHVLPHSTAVGKVLLADRPPDEAAATVRRIGLPARTATTITDPDAFAVELRRVREQRWAIDRGEEDADVCCVAVPVCDAGLAVAAMSVSGPSNRLNIDGIDELTARMRGIADAMLARSGSTARDPVSPRSVQSDVVVVTAWPDAWLAGLAHPHFGFCKKDQREAVAQRRASG